MKDYIFKPRLDHKGDVDRTRLKLGIAALLGDRMVDGKARYLFSAEPLIPRAGEWYRLRVMDGSDVPNMREIQLANPAAGDDVSLSAWIALDTKDLADKKPMSVVSIRCRERIQWIAGQKFSDILDDPAIVVGDTIRIMTATSRGMRLARPYGHITVTGCLRDTQKFEDIQRSGIGEARAYGFGLVAANHLH